MTIDGLISRCVSYASLRTEGRNGQSGTWEDPVVTISRRVTIGHGAIIHARVIGPEASIGMGAVLSLCSEIGAGSIVAESALVPQGKIIPPETLVAGVPARPLRELTDKDRTDWRETKDWYVRMAAQYLDPDNYHPVK